jgi:hypothetical protein
LINKEQSHFLNLTILNSVNFLKKTEKSCSPEVLFEKVWSSLIPLLTNNTGSTDTSEDKHLALGPYQFNIYEFLLFKIVFIFQRLGIDYIPKVILNNKKCYSQITNSSNSVLIIGLHSDFTHAIKAFEDSAKSITTIGLNSFAIATLKRSGIKRAINIIEPDQYCLLKLRGAVKDCHLLFCLIDWKSEDGIFKYISPALLNFAKLHNIQTYYSYSEVSPIGVINLHLQLSNNLSNVNEAALNYIRYLNNFSSFKRVLSLKDMVKDI